MALAYIGVCVVTAVQKQGLQQVTQLRDEVEVGDRDGELQLLHQLPSVHTFQHIVHSWGRVLGKELLQQACFCSIAPAAQPSMLSVRLSLAWAAAVGLCDQ